MIVRGIVLIDSITNELHQKVSVHPFVMMERDEVEVINTQECADRQNRDRGDSPETFRDVSRRRVTLISIRGAERRNRLFIGAGLCRACTHQPHQSLDIVRRTAR